MNPSIEIQELDPKKPVEREALASFYERCGYRGEALDSDRVLVAVMGCTVVGAVRACGEEGHLVLRGLFVCPKQRGRGIGKELLAAWTERFGDHEALCLPLARHEELYRQAGFVRLEPAALPPHLALRFEAYRSRGLSTIAMRRP